MTINEIAKIAGVSNAAVSRYLNGGSLSQEKKARIRTVIEETGYRPDTYAQMLRTKKIRQIGVIVPKINSNSVAAVTAGISKVLSEENYMFLLANTDNNEKRELDYLELFGANRVAGVILLATIITPEHEKKLSESSIPVVLVGQKHKRFPCVYHNDYDAPRELDEMLLKKGCRKFCYIGVTERDVAVGQLRKQALIDACKEYGISKEEIVFVEGTFEQNSGYEMTEKLLKTVTDMDAVVCATDDMAIGCIRALKKHGKRVPEDVSVVGIGDTWSGQVVDPSLTTVHYFYEESGEEAAHMMLDMLDPKGSRMPVRQTMLGYELKIRGSV